MHFIMMSCLPVMWVNGSVYSNEMFDPKWRIMNIAFNLIPIISYAFGLIVYLNRTWTGIHVSCGVISAITLLVWFMVPESPRWLAQNGHENEAMESKLHTVFPPIVSSLEYHIFTYSFHGNYSFLKLENVEIFI